MSQVLCCSKNLNSSLILNYMFNLVHLVKKKSHFSKKMLYLLQYLKSKKKVFKIFIFGPYFLRFGLRRQGLHKIFVNSIKKMLQALCCTQRYFLGKYNNCLVIFFITLHLYYEKLIFAIDQKFLKARKKIE